GRRTQAVRRNDGERSIPSDRGDDSRFRSNFANSKIEGVRDKEVACRINSHTGWIRQGCCCGEAAITGKSSLAISRDRGDDAVPTILVESLFVRIHNRYVATGIDRYCTDVADRRSSPLTVITEKTNKTVPSNGGNDSCCRRNFADPPMICVRNIEVACSIN